MATKNKSTQSRKLFQTIRNTKGKIDLFNEYITFYKEHLDKLFATKREEIVQKYKEELDSYEFYINDEDSVIGKIVEKYGNDKSKELRLQYRKMREENKRAIAEDSSKETELNAKLTDYEKQLAKELDSYKEELVNSVKEQRAKANIEEYKAKYTALKGKEDEELKKFDESSVKAKENHFHRVAEKYGKRINKLEAKLKVDKAQLDKNNELDAINFSMKDDEILKIEDLCMYFGGLHAVDHLNFEVKKGEIFGLIGPNGAGKTTVFNCIAQFNKCTAGNISFRTKENDLVDLNEEIVHDIITLGIARTFQNVEVIRECTVLENLLIAANRQFQSTLFDHLVHTNMLKLEEQVITQRAMKVLAFMGLLPYAYHYAMGLPYGILKKIEIARTLMVNPQLIILDEPAAGLNENETQELSKLIKSIQKEYDCTILLVEHDMGLVMSICDRICAISFGKFLACGTPEEIQHNKLVQEAYLGTEEE